MICHWFLLLMYMWKVLNEFCLFEYKNRSANKGALFVSKGIQTDFWKTWFPKTTKMLSMRNASIAFISSSAYLFLESEWCSAKTYMSISHFFHFWWRSNCRAIMSEIQSLIYCAEWSYKVLESHISWCCWYEKVLGFQI